eukprot:g7236.t1
MTDQPTPRMLIVMIIGLMVLESVAANAWADALGPDRSTSQEQGQTDRGRAEKRASQDPAHDPLTDVIDGAESAGHAFGCKNCPSGKYQDASSHRSSCKLQAECSSGEYFSGGSGSSPGSCKNCPSGKYQDAGSHRSSCKWQAECSYGKYFSGGSSSYGSCKDCPFGQYQASSNHRSSCKWQAECSSGEYFS